MGDNTDSLSVPSTGSTMNEKPREGAEQDDTQRSGTGKAADNNVLNGIKNGLKKSKTQQRPVNQNAAALDLSHQRTAAEVAKMTEEDLIADYNAPIHMCTPLPSVP